MLYNTNAENPYDFTSGDFSGGSEQSSSSNSQQSSSSYTGLPDWFKSIKGWGGNNYDISGLWNNTIKYGMIDPFRRALQGGRVSPEAQKLIEQQRQLMPEQYAQQMALSNARQVQAPLNRMSSRGVLNSSVTGDALAKVLREQSARQADQYTQANTWAGNELLKNMGVNQQMDFETWKQAQAFLPQLLAAIRESQSQSQGSSNSESSGSSWSAPIFPGME
jgi:hypothetical protein